MASLHELDPDLYRAISDLKVLVNRTAPCRVEVLHDHLCHIYDSNVLKALGTDPYSLAKFLNSVLDDFTVWKNENGEWLIDRANKPDSTLPNEEDSEDIVSRVICFMKQTLEQSSPYSSVVMYHRLNQKFGKAATDLMEDHPHGLVEFLKERTDDFMLKFQAGDKCLIYLTVKALNQLEKKNIKSAEDGQATKKRIREPDDWADTTYAKFHNIHIMEVEPTPIQMSRTPSKNTDNGAVTWRDVLNFVVAKLSMANHRIRCEHLQFAISQEAQELLEVIGLGQESMKEFLEHFPDMFNISPTDYVFLNENFQVHAKSGDCNIPSREYEVNEQYAHAQDSTSGNCGAEYVPGNPRHSATATTSTGISCSGIHIKGRGRIISTGPHGGVLVAPDSTTVAFGPHCAYFKGEPVCHSYFGLNTVVNFDAVFEKVVSTATRIWL